jgi:putative aldouronate transport system substrate-binding protein
MEMKKSSLLIASILAVVSVFWGCKNDPGKGKGDITNDGNINLSGTMPIIKDPSKFPNLDVLMVQRAEQILPTNEIAMLKKIAETTGVYFNWIEIPHEGAVEKINLMLASGTELPDVLWNNAPVAQYVNEDIFVPSEDLVEKYMPKLKAIYKDHPNYRGMVNYPDGHSYGFPYIEEVDGLVLTPGPFLINTEWLKKVGKKMPATVDEFTDVLRAFRDGGDLNGNGKADEVPYAVYLTGDDWSGACNTFNQFTGAFGQADSYGGKNTNNHLRVIDGKVVFTASDVAFRETAKYFNMLKNEKLLDVDSFSPGPSAGMPLYQHKLAEPVALIGVVGMWGPDSEIVDPNVRRQYKGIPRLSGPRGKTGFILNSSEMHDPSRAVITTTCKYPEVVAAFVDCLYDPEISLTMNWGAEGIVFRRGDDNKLHYRLDDKNNIELIDPYKSYNEMRFNSALPDSPLAILTEYFETIGDYPWDAISITEGQIANGKHELLKEYIPVPKIILKPDEQTKISMIAPIVGSIVQRYTFQWVLDGDADKTWGAYLGELNAAGVNDLVQVYQEAYERFLGSGK